MVRETTVVAMRWEGAHTDMQQLQPSVQRAIPPPAKR